MVVLVPDDLATFEASLDAQRVKDIMASIRTYSLELSLPKFKFEAPLGLKDILIKLGMTDAFDDSVADFSGIDGTRNLVISDVLHKGFIAIDENGTEAAAATAVVVGTTSAPEPATLAVDKPFVFFIRDRLTGAILFVGRVVDPR
jgi:serpin B